MESSLETGTHRGPSRPSLDAAALSIFALVLLSTALKWTLYAHQSLGLDETFTAMVASQPTVGRFLHQCQNDVYAPLSYLVSWGWAKVAGLSDTALRLPSVVFSCLAPILALAPSRLVPRTVRLTWAALLALWLPGFLFAQTARCYALLLLLGTANAVAYLGLLKETRAPRAWAWSVISSLFILDHYFAAILIACQAIAYLALYRERALATWPAALAFLPAVLSVVLKIPLLVSYARPGVSWMPLLQLKDLPALAQFVAGAGPIVYAVLSWGAIGLILKGRSRRIGRTLAIGSAERGLWLTAGLAVAATTLLLGLGFVKALVTTRYLTPFVPGLFLALALVAYRFSRFWPLAPAILLTAPVSLALIFALKPPTGPLPTLAFEDASQSLMQYKVRRLVFFWDNPLAQTAISQSFVEVGGFFFNRAGRSIPVDTPQWTNEADPNRLLAAHAAAPGTGFLWLYDLDRPGTLAIRHPPALTGLKAKFICHDFGGGRLGVLACRPNPSADKLPAMLPGRG